VFLISAVSIQGHFEEETPREIYQDGLVLATQCPGPLGICNPKETGLPAFPTYSSDLDPWDYQLFSGLRKTNECSPFFARHGDKSCRVDLVGQTKL
jgi:hypothetical protein